LVGLIEGAMAVVTVGAVIVSALDRYLAGGGQPGLVAVVDEAGVRLAAGADDAGALVALFLAALMPAWWARVAKS
jgi:hypothetical protein